MPTDQPPTPECPSLELLDALATGAQDAETLRHTDTCDRCRELLNEMRSANRFLERFNPASAPAAPTPSAADPVRVKGYHIQGVLAFGGQGAVYRAVQQGTDRPVAIKVPLDDTQRKPAARYRFEREIELTARLNHPAIVRVIGPCELADGRVGCVMQFIEGQPFHDWAADQRRTNRESQKGIVRAAATIADAIAYAHQRAVLHRDIKPSNVIVTAQGEPHVLDFGLAKAIDDTHQSFATLTGAFVGTIAYSAPEQIQQGADAIDMRTDVYALGLLLYQALTGRLPFNTDAPTTELLRQIRETDPPKPSSLDPAIGTELDAVLLKALAKSKDRRYATAAEFRDDLHAWLQGRAVRARVDSRLYVLRKTIARRRKPIAAAAVIAAALLSGAGVSVYNILSAADAERREQYETLRAASEVNRADAVQQVIDELIPTQDITNQPARDNLDRLDAKLEAGLLHDRPLVEASVRALLASIYADRDALDLAEYNYRQALALTRRNLTPEGPEASRLADRLAATLLGRGKLEEAQALAEQTLANRADTLDPGHADIAESLTTLGQIRLSRGHPDHAARLAERAAAILAAAPTATGRQSLACAALQSRVARAQDRPGDARAHATEALRLALKTHSDEHPTVARSIREFADLTDPADPHRAADAALARTLASTRTADRPAHVWESLIDLKQRVLGDRAPELAPSYTFLGRASEREGDPQRAADAHLAALSILRETEGPDSLAVADCAYYLQYPLARLGRMQEWEQLLAHRYRVYAREHLGTANIAIVIAHREWAAALANIGNDARAEAELLDTLEQIKTLCHRDPYETLRVNTTLAEVLAARGDMDRAIPLANEVYQAAQLQQRVEHQRAAFVLALGAAHKRELENAAAHLDTYMQLPDLGLSSALTGPRVTSRRILDQIINAYAQANAPEPPALSKLRNVHGLELP